MKLISWNTNGFRATAKNNCFEWLQEEDPDIFCLQEVKAEFRQVQPLPEALLKYPYIYWNHSKEKKGYSGTATFSKIEPNKIQYDLGVEDMDKEGRMVETHFDNFILINLYFPNSGMIETKRMEFKLEFNKVIYKRVESYIKEGKNVIITGDYNVAHKEIDIARPKENEGSAGFTKEERAWMDDFTSIPMIDTFRLFHQEPHRYSWWNMRFGAKKKNIGWRIDYFCVNDSFKKNVIDADILDTVDGSDHAPIVLELKS
ncbi:MAG: exodeoxyribonuclease III [bacterium]